MNATSLATFRSPAFVNASVRLVVFHEQAANARLMGFLSALPAVSADMEIHVVAMGRRRQPKLNMRVLRRGSELASARRLTELNSEPAQQLLSNCGPGSIHEMLARYYAKIDASLAILAMDSTNWIDPWPSVSLAETLARRFPVLAIPADGSVAPFPASRPVRWLVPLDGSPSAEAILDPLHSVANWLSSDITLLQPLEYARLWQTRVAQNRPASISRLGPSIADSFKYLSRIAGSRFANSPTRVCCTTEPDAVRSIVRLANSSALDAVAIGLSNRWRITRLFAAELNEQLLRRVRKPILLLQSGSR